MKKITYKNYEIYDIENYPRLGDYDARYFRINNRKSKNKFSYIVKISRTISIIKRIDTDEKFLKKSLDYIKDEMDRGNEKNDFEIFITAYTEEEKKKNLGIFYTNQGIVNFIFDILKILKEKEDKESGRWESKKHYPSVIDPAVGEGVFLKSAVQSGFTKTEYIFGLDIDEDVVKKWKDINLLKEFGGKENDLEAHFFHQNGLDKIHWEQHTKKYRYKLKQKDIDAQQFDAVVGNPPYGGVGLSETGLTDNLILQLANFEILPEKVKDNLISANTQNDLFNSDKHFSIKPDAKQRIKSFAIEILFIERFIQLAKPGGWIAIIIPDGILTNSNSHYVREFISEKTRVEAIISLPRDAFKNVGTSAKTSILFLQKYKDQMEKRDLNYPVFLASTESLEEKYFNIIKDAYRKHYIKL